MAAKDACNGLIDPDGRNNHLHSLAIIYYNGAIILRHLKYHCLFNKQNILALKSNWFKTVHSDDSNSTCFDRPAVSISHGYNNIKYLNDIAQWFLSNFSLFELVFICVDKCNAKIWSFIQWQVFCLLYSTGPFRHCDAYVDGNDYYESCLYDACVLGPDSDAVCSIFEQYAQICQSYGQSVYEWRGELRQCGEQNCVL